MKNDTHKENGWPDQDPDSWMPAGNCWASSASNPDWLRLCILEILKFWYSDHQKQTCGFFKNSPTTTYSEKENSVFFSVRLAEYWRWNVPKIFKFLSLTSSLKVSTSGQPSCNLFPRFASYLYEEFRSFDQFWKFRADHK